MDMVQVILMELVELEAATMEGQQMVQEVVKRLELVVRLMYRDTKVLIQYLKIQQKRI